MIFAYLTPDTFVPIAGAWAMIAGGLLAFWPKVKIVTGKTWRAITGRPNPPAPAADPSATPTTGAESPGQYESPPGI
jgi:hypothetical protein